MIKYLCLLLAIVLLANAPALQRTDGAVRLTTPVSGMSDQNPAFSPDGDRILFTRFTEGYNDGPADLYLLDSAKRETERFVTAADTDNVNLPGSSWNAATKRITFSSDREDTDEVWTISAASTDLLRVTYTADGAAMEPSFSPDGHWIVFELNQGEMGSLWKIRADGTTLTQITSGQGFDDRQPNWSPIDDRILFQRREPGSDNWDLYTLRADGSNLVQVTDHESSDTDASWSPDGAWMVYSSDFGGLEFANLFIIAADGGTPQRLTVNPTRYDGAPSWSPDGTWIAFESGGDEQPTSLWQIEVPELTPG